MTNPLALETAVRGLFLDRHGEPWYRIEGIERMAPFFLALTSDSDLWAFVSSSGSLAAGRRDPEQSFFPYETVDRIHLRWEHTGPRTFIRIRRPGGWELWEPFARRPGPFAGRRSLEKNRLGTRLVFEEVHPDGDLVFRFEWASAGNLGLVRRASVRSLSGGADLEILDGLVNLLPAGVATKTWFQFSSLVDAYKWSEAQAGGRLGVYSLYAQIWDRAEPKESFHALTAWHTGLDQPLTLLSDRQVEAFCAGEPLTPENLVRGRPGAFLQAFGVRAEPAEVVWYQVVDGPLSQVRTADLADRLARGGGTPAEVERALDENDRGLAELLAKADGFQITGDPMAGFHHTANVLFNIMRGGVFVDGLTWDQSDFLAFATRRNRTLGPLFVPLLKELPADPTRAQVLAAASAAGPQFERLALGYLPLTFSRRHGDPSRPWNKFSINVRDAVGRRTLDHQGNWRDIFQNWEALLWSEPGYLGSVISTFVGAMTPDGHNPYRISRDGIEWETIEPDDPWSYIGYWGDHQVVYLLRLLELAEALEPGLLGSLWHRPVFSFADVPYRLQGYAAQVANPKNTIDFDHKAHAEALDRAREVGGDGKLVTDGRGHPVLGTLAEKLAAIVLDKAGNLVPGGGIWLNTQRPEWNDANNALVGWGLSVVTLASFRRFLVFLVGLPFLDEPLVLPRETAQALGALSELASLTGPGALTEPLTRRTWLDQAGRILEDWRTALYRGWSDRTLTTLEPGALRILVGHLLPLVDGTLRANRRPDGLYHSYNLLALGPGVAEISHLYPMLEGQAALVSSGLLTPGEVADLGRALVTSDLYDPVRNSFLLYPDRNLPGFLVKNRLDPAALGHPDILRLAAQVRSDLFQTQADGTVRFAPGLANRFDVETALGQDPGARSVADVYERLLDHKNFTGRSGTMFGYEGLGCIYWHMVAKLLLAVQESVFAAADQGSPELGALVDLYRRIRSGLGYRKSPDQWGAFPSDPYSHTPAQGGAQQPGMTGQVKEEILARWGELGLRWAAGVLRLDFVLFDRDELAGDGCLRFTYQRIPFLYRTSDLLGCRIRTASGWEARPDGTIPLGRALEVEVGF